MEVYGNFTVGRKIGGGPASAVFLAQSGKGPGAGDHVVKVCSPDFALLEVDVVEASTRSAFLEQAQSRIDLQKRAAQDSTSVAPILEHGRDESSVWYASRFYPRTLERILRERTRLASRQVIPLLLGAVKGALAFQQVCGRSHGNLTPTNLLVAAAGRLETATVVVTDPAPGGVEDAELCERSDLKAIGQLIYQIVSRKRVAPQEWDNLLLPLQLTNDWTAAFGRDAPRWLALCNRLLDPHLRLTDLNLVGLKKELVRLKPKAVFSPLVVGAIVLIAAVGGLGGWWAFQSLDLVGLTLDSDPAGAALVINGQAAGIAPWTGKLHPGRVTVLASNEIGVIKNELVLAHSKATNYSFKFEYGRAVITSEPSGAAVSDPDERLLGTTPLVTPRMKPGQYSYLLRFTNYRPASVEVTIPANGGTNNAPIAALRPIAGPGVSVTIRVEPRELGNRVIVTNIATLQGSHSPSVFDLKPGQTRFELLLPEPWPPSSFEVQVGTNAQQTFSSRIPSGRLDLDSAPPGAAVWAGTTLVGVTPTNLLWPTGTYVFEWRLPYHSTNRLSTNLLDGSIVRHAEKLEQMLSPARLSANLNGAFVYGTNPPLSRTNGWSVGTNVVNVMLPDTEALIAEFADEALGSLTPVIVSRNKGQKGQTNEFRFDFDYGTVLLEPPPGSIVTVGTQELKARPLRRVQRSGEPVTYNIAAAHFNPANVPLQVKKGETVSTNIQLSPTLYNVYLQLSPPVAQAQLLSSGLALSNGVNRLPWGPAGRYEVTASYPRLASVTSNIAMSESGVTQSISLDYALVTIASKQRGVEISVGKEKLGSTPLTNIYLPPGQHKFTAVAKGGGFTSWVTNLQNGASETIVVP